MNSVAARVAAAVLAVNALAAPAGAVEFPAGFEANYARDRDCRGYWRVHVLGDMVEFHHERGDSLRLTILDLCNACSEGVRRETADVAAPAGADDAGALPVFRFHTGSIPGSNAHDRHGRSRLDGAYARMRDAADAAPLQKCEK